MNGKITLPAYDRAQAEAAMERLTGMILSAARGDVARIVVDYRARTPVYSIEITTSDFGFVISELEADGFEHAEGRQHGAADRDRGSVERGAGLGPVAAGGAAGGEQ